MERSNQAVVASEQGEASANEGIVKVQKTQAHFCDINSMMESITGMSIEMASATEEQSNVSVHIDEQITGIAAASSSDENECAAVYGFQ